MSTNDTNKIKNGGQAVMIVVVLTLLASLSVFLGISFTALNETGSSRRVLQSEQSIFLSEAGVEDMVYRFKTNKQTPSPVTLTLDGNSTVVTVSDVIGGKKITSSGSVSDYQRKSETTISNSQSSGISFNYGAQVGDGGLEMSNGSRVEGGVYSNGPIIGPSSGSTARITGNAFAAGTSQIEDLNVGGNARANGIRDTNIDGSASSTSLLEVSNVGVNAYAAQIINSYIIRDAYANSITGGTFVERDCYYLTKDDSILCTNEFPGTPFTPLLNLPALNMPIPDSQINQWKTDAAAGGTIIGDYNVASNVSLGPKKITGDLEMDSNNKTLTVTGTIYVQGNIDISNGSAIKCDASFGANSCIILADGWIHLKNNGQFRGSGTPGSYLVLLSTLACTGSAGIGCGHHNEAIDLHNNATGAIFYAGNGLIYLHNNVTATNLTAYKIHLENGAKIIYEIGLQNVQFSGGGGGGFDIQSWKEIE